MTTMIPAPPASAARLAPTFDAARLNQELAAVTGHEWARQRTHYAAGRIGPDTPVDWRVLPLRSPGGDPHRTDPGGPGPDDYAPTHWLEQMPYLAGILETIPAPLNAVRLLALGLGAASKPHCDPKYTLQRGMVRLHIPIVTHPDAVLILDGTEHRWQPGEFWYGDFSREHQVRNTGPVRRIHTVIDALFTRELAALFPDQWQEGLIHAGVLFNRRPVPSRHQPSLPLPPLLNLPAGFTDFGQDTPPTGPVTTARLTERGSGLVLAADERSFALTAVADGEYRFAGWSEQRTLQLGHDHVVLHVRHGRTLTSQQIPLPTTSA
ncbi:aspartyl/asparaginyl beta-hydroxylase domain-containing protein [Streptomyces sp. NWU49]|uniref:aspartyl/asparaginyl beta-hydroxylase domain-containing protein n=1 Tax=Streptomyces sp. NWU49 TaxID=2201153 RepID=UPI000D67CFA8|nr:aspartyl/asparaginyl beta-hydroxylase domain-containing protein [Streptomyces sp. NWU49]PWJ05061.1 aspartyl/asparaginyl beta-hydroxylase domain-containing protein [Streptomyces sp. NWU49]